MPSKSSSSRNDFIVLQLKFTFVSRGNSLKSRSYFENSGPNWSKLGSFVDKHHILHVIDLIFHEMEKKLCNGDISLLPMPLVSSVKGQSKLPKSLLVGGQCLDRVMFCLKPFDFNDFSLKLTKYLMFPDSHFCLKI